MAITNNIPNSKRVILTGIDPSAIQHPLDKTATEQLKKLRGFDRLVKWYLEFGFERAQHFINVAGSIQVGPKQFPSLYNMLREACTVLDVAVPDLYVSQTGLVNAYTAGHTKPYITLFSDLLDLLSDEEIMAVIAHEVGHIKCNHVLYRQMAAQIANIVTAVKNNIPAVGPLLGMGIDVAVGAAFMTWIRRSELSGDRAALLVVQKPEPCISMLMKLAGGTQRFISELNAEEFLRQADAYVEEGDHNMLNRFFNFLASADKGDHPWAVERARYLNEWIDSHEFDQILAGNYPRVSIPIPNGPKAPPPPTKYCKKCGRPADAADKFCSGCGQPLIVQG